jgi:hypothetical protein
MAISAFEEDEISEKIPDIQYVSAGFAEKSTAKNLQSEFAAIADGMAAQVDKTSLRLLSCATIEEFRQLRKELFPIFVNLSKAFSSLALATIPPPALGRIIQESINETEQEFVSHGHCYLSDDEYKEALFSILTLKSTQKLIPHLITCKPKDEPEDRKLANDYFIATAYARMHLHCLQMAMESSMSLNQDILKELLGGMRTSLMAYSYARAGLELRGLPNYGEPQEEIIWDEEDQALANAE